MFPISLPKRKDAESRPAQRDAPARANAGPQVVNEFDPTMAAAGCRTPSVAAHPKTRATADRPPLP
jgi:hypothetical protein